MLDPDEDDEPFLGKTPHEPEEFDPSSLGPDNPDPSDLGPEVPEAPEAPDAPDGAADSEVLALFWKLVVVFNAALLALSVGPMLAYFEGQVDLGLRIFAVGAVLFGYGSYRYVQFRRDRDDAAGDDTTGDQRAAEETDDAGDHNG